MSHLFRSIGACLLGFALSPFLTAPANAVSAVAQVPCVQTGGACLTFTNSTNPIPAARSFTFNMPGPGKALVRFDGTMQCVVTSSLSNQDVIDLASQIVRGATTVPDYTGPGGNRYAMRLNRSTTDSNDFSIAVNLAASRLFNFDNAGDKRVHFKFNKIRMDSGTSCSVFTAAFTVIRFP